MILHKTCFYFFLFILLASCNNEVKLTNPQETKHGTSTSFDNILNEANKKWKFLFRNETQLFKTDINGQNEEILIDISSYTKDENSKLLSMAFLSPNKKQVILYYYSERDYHNQIVGKALLLNLWDKTVEQLHSNYEDFAIDWIAPAYWLDSNIFILPINKFNEGEKKEEGGGYYMNEIFKYIKFNLSENKTELISFDYRTIWSVWMPDSKSLIYICTNETPTLENTRVLSINGKREAIDREFVYLKQKRYKKPGVGIVSEKFREMSNISIENVSQNNDEYWDRYYLKLNDSIVRCSKGRIETFPIWDPQLNLYYWYETSTPYKVYYMDILGHYRMWHEGFYCGKVPVENEN